MNRDRKNELARRSFLKALSLGVAAPLALQASRLAVAAPGPRPLRMIFFYMPHGMPMEHFNPMGTADNFTLTMSGESVLAPLEPYKKYVNFLRGFEYKGINNHPAIRWTLTGNENAPISIDRAIAKALGTQPVNLGVVPFQTYWGPDMYLIKDGTWIRPEPSPVAAADRLFPPTSGMMNSDLEFRRSALGLTEREIDRLMKANTDLTREQSKLQIHLEAVRAIKSGGTGSTNTCTGQPSMPTVSALRASKANVLETSNLPQVLDAQLELAAQSVICGAARVLTIQNLWATSDVNFSFMGISKNHHDPASHSWDAAGRAEFARIQRYYYQHLVDKLVKVLQATPDAMDTTAPGRTVLDNTLIYVFSEIADGADHNSNKGTVWLNGQPTTSYLPLVTIGGGAGAIKTGRLFDFDNRSHGDLLYTLSEIAGVPQTSFGTSITEVKA
ncbi:MAG: DUF1552 domain-containing protein [Polyangia bacterium]